ncbi:DUF3592 domain-containing protein [Microbispora bryophytorum]|uniref:DUF3592 domain-containing protein n=1 Tax=Microbispora bryophytorum TaxID=1460882 RepID=A0A8H9GYD1_9ACTN|nr:DUF3592 domain-containing protein [Microbispora bryophytorum]MBD3139087.1 DUF3592 domain-containing protein [Microbispora bryophytorum]GGO09369.1 hypothetical protein GCM10011574_24760 [Microbispora bryophytorum]
MSQTALITLILSGLGLVFGLIGGGITMNAREFRRRAQRTRGLVVGLRASRSDDGTSYYPTIRFTTVYGQQVEAETTYGSNPPPARPGEEVAVLYDPARPTRIRLDSAAGSGALLGGIFLAVGVALFTAGAGVVLVQTF